MFKECWQIDTHCHKIVCFIGFLSFDNVIYFLWQELCACFGIANTEDPVCLCLTSDQVSDRDSFWEVTDDVMKGMDQWWKALMTSKREDPAMTKDVYEELVAK